MDQNDNFPLFSNGSYIFEVSENAKIGSKIGQIEASDLDSGDFGTIRFSITHEKFRIDHETGELFLRGKLDREFLDSYRFTVKVIDKGGLTSTSEIIIKVLDLNDNPPIILNREIKCSVKEGSKILQRPILIQVEDNDIGRNKELFLMSSHPDIFKIGRISNELWNLTLLKPFFLESENPWSGEIVKRQEFEITVIDNGEVQLNSSKNIDVEIIDQNDHIPSVTWPSEITLIEESTASEKIVEFEVIDNDPCAPNNLVTLSLIGENAEYFYIEDRYLKTSVKPIDYEKVGPQVALTMIAKDRGIPTLENSFSIIINIIDKNDENPKIHVLSTIPSIDENMIGKIISINIVDPDLNAALQTKLSCYCQKGQDSVLCENLQSTLEFIEITEPFDFEQVDEILCDLMVIDENGLEFQSDEIPFALSINDVNDNVPEFYRSEFFFDVVENLLLGQIIGSVQDCSENFVRVFYKKMTPKSRCATQKASVNNR